MDSRLAPVETHQHSSSRQARIRQESLPRRQVGCCGSPQPTAIVWVEWGWLLKGALTSRSQWLIDSNPCEVNYPIRDDTVEWLGSYKANNENKDMPALTKKNRGIQLLSFLRLLKSRSKKSCTWSSSFVVWSRSAANKGEKKLGLGCLPWSPRRRRSDCLTLQAAILTRIFSSLATGPYA